MPPRSRDTQDPLPFDAPESDSRSAPKGGSGEATGTRRGPGRPRKWASEAERKRAYRERLAADLAEPERLRRELRAERRAAAEKDRKLARLESELARVEATLAAATDRHAELEAIAANLEARVEDWRSRARALAKKRDDEREKTPRSARSGTEGSPAKTKLELPNLRREGPPEPRSSRRRR